MALPAAAFDSGSVLMIAGAHPIELEGVDRHEDVIERLIHSGIPVMGHLGLEPQSVHAYGSFGVQGRESESARNIVRQAAALQELGVFAIVLECVPEVLARETSESLRFRRSASEPVWPAMVRSWSSRSCWA